MKVKYVFIIAAVLGALSFVVYHIKGSYVDEKGVLVEAFALIPTGFFFACVAAICGTYILARYLVRLLKKT